MVAPSTTAGHGDEVWCVGHVACRVLHGASTVIGFGCVYGCDDDDDAWTWLSWACAAMASSCPSHSTSLSRLTQLTVQRWLGRPRWLLCALTLTLSALSPAVTAEGVAQSPKHLVQTAQRSRCVSSATAAAGVVPPPCKHRRPPSLACSQPELSTVRGSKATRQVVGDCSTTCRHPGVPGYCVGIVHDAWRWLTCAAESSSGGVDGDCQWHSSCGADGCHQLW